jgi:3-oxoacyl-[acyl-carrier protein] reductase
MNLDQLKMIVTGGAQGMGRHFAMRLAEAGAQVAVGDVNEEGLQALATESEGLAGKVHTRRLDVSNEEDVGGFVDWAHEQMGGLTGLINNAGILRDGLLVKKRSKNWRNQKADQRTLGRGDCCEPDRSDFDGARHRRQNGRER